MENILSTYRLQLHKDFRFSDVEKIVPYLKKLGITTIYCSPIFKAVEGSQHGYDILDPNQVNAELGNEEEFKNILSLVKREGLTWIQDIVPNHMAYSPQNPWILDVLEKGIFSIYAPFFDIAWNDESWNGKLMLPFLGKDLADAISNKEIFIAYQNKRISLLSFESAYPVQPRTYSRILENCQEKTESIKQFLIQLEDLHRTEDKIIFHNLWNELLMQFDSIMQNEKSGPVILNEFEKINADTQYLSTIIEDQHYRLCNWQETDTRINYRRFFTVNGLICLNIHDENVFEKHHELIFNLVNDGSVQGLRIDHIDGLFDPTKYLQTLRNNVGTSYIVVEKILEPRENFPHQWPVEGNTGYDFLSLANNLLTWKTSEKSFTRFYKSLVEDHSSLTRQTRDKKSMILSNYMRGELENLLGLLLNSGLIQEKDHISTEDLRSVISEFLVHCPVYRYYGNQLPFEKEEENSIRRIFQEIKNSRPELNMTSGFLETLLLNHNEKNEVHQRSILNFYQRCMQFSGPVMAKGVEDTLMYTYNRFISHNEVGDSPGAFGISAEEFHMAMKERQKLWPLTMNTTSTHDTKRGEDARARLNVLSQMPQEWITTMEDWMQKNKIFKKAEVPDLNDEYFIIQTIIATIPLGAFKLDEYKERLFHYFIKAFREAKRFSSWAKPNKEFESAINDFVSSLLNEKNEFPESLRMFIRKINDHSIINSLSQLVLKTTCPGIPDIYQGCEFWDFNLVDPDNRRPVDYETRENYLDEMESGKCSEGLFNNLWQNRNDGGIKLWLTQKLLEIRRSHPVLFQMGEYLPLNTEGKYKEHVFAFARKFKNEVIIVAIPLHTFIISREQQKDIGELDWKDTRLELLADTSGEWKNLLNDKTFQTGTELRLDNSWLRPCMILKSISTNNLEKI